ncbi:MAG: DUF456 domain-containing protein [bacterium]|nr:DUF456 domain-containing protein [bacterium]
MDIFIAIMALLLGLVGVVGSILPIIPGPPIGYIGLLILQLQEQAPFSTKYLVIWSLVVIGITALDYVIPQLGTKKWGGTKYGIWGSTIGLIVGLFFGPVGMIVGPMVGAFLGELYHQKDGDKALRAAFGSFIGFLVGTGLKLVCTVIICYQIVVNGLI